MAENFTSVVRAYIDQLLQLSVKINQCGRFQFLAGIPLVLVNQVSFILALMLPLKVIIMLGTDGVPRYFRFFMAEETRTHWMLGFAGAAVGFFLIYAISDMLLSGLSKRGAERVLAQSRKASLFDDQERFASDIFLRVVGSWGTLAMVVAGIALGLLLEWRLVALLLTVIFLEFVLFVVYWNRFLEPERSGEHERLAAKRMDLLKKISALNVMIFFGGLVFLLLTDPRMNFIIALVMFILTRQILARLTSMLGDANFFLQQRERIDALVHPDRHLRERRPSANESFERLLIPERRGRLFQAVASAANRDLDPEGWQWRDLPGNGVALFVKEAQNPGRQELRLKLRASESGAGTGIESMFYHSESAQRLSLCCELLAAGSVFGRAFLLLGSTSLRICPRKQLQEASRRIRTRLWAHEPDSDLASRLLRSFPALDARLQYDRLARIRLACNSRDEEQLVDRFLARRPELIDAIAVVPKVLINRGMGRANVLLDGQENPVLLNWNSIRIDFPGSDLVPADLRKKHPPEQIIEAVSERGALNAEVQPHNLQLVVHLSQIDQCIENEVYGQALRQASQVLQIMDNK